MYPVVFVSLGHGEADLITLKGLKALQSADCIFYPTTISKDGTKKSRAFDILSELGITQTLIDFHVPMNKNRSLAIQSYESIAENIKQRFKNNEKVIVVAEGDVGFYSSIHYIADKLEQYNIPIDQIAGIPAFIASGALAGIHIVKQEEKLIVIPGIVTSNDLQLELEKGNVIVIMKTSQSEKAIKDCINQLPSATYHYFENVGVKDHEFYTKNIMDISMRKFPYFSLMIIHK